MCAEFYISLAIQQNKEIKGGGKKEREKEKKREKRRGEKER